MSEDRSWEEVDLFPNSALTRAWSDRFDERRCRWTYLDARDLTKLAPVIKMLWPEPGDQPDETETMNP